MENQKIRVPRKPVAAFGDIMKACAVHDERFVGIGRVIEMFKETGAKFSRRKFYREMETGEYKLARVVLSGTTEKPTVVRYRLSEILEILPITEEERITARAVMLSRLPVEIPVYQAAEVLDCSPSFIYDITATEDQDKRLANTGAEFGKKIFKKDLYQYVEDRTIEAE